MDYNFAVLRAYLLGSSHSIVLELDYSRAWLVPKPRWPIRLARAMRVVLSDDGFVALEGRAIRHELEEMVRPYLVPTQHDILGADGPAAKWLHLRATADALAIVERSLNHFSPPEICDHLYGYEDGALRLEWHDAFYSPIYIAETVSEEVVSAFCSELGVGPAKRIGR